MALPQSIPHSNVLPLKRLPMIVVTCLLISGIRLRFVGDIYVGEILAFILLVSNSISAKNCVSTKSKVDRYIYLWICAQLISNLLNQMSLIVYAISLGTPIILLIIIKAGLVLWRRDYNLRQILIYFFAGQIIGSLLQPKDFALVNGWKYGYGFCVIALGVLLLNYSKRIFYLRVFLILCTLYSITHASRSLGAITLLCFIFSFFPMKTTKHKMGTGLSFIKIFASVLATLLIFVGYTTISSKGILGEEERLRASRLTVSSLGPLVARGELFYAGRAFLNRPLLGYGGQPKVEQEFLVAIATKLRSLGDVGVSYLNLKDDRLPTHSMILGSLVFAGVFALPFWIRFLHYCFMAFNKLTLVSKVNRTFPGLIVFNSIWSAFFSPLGASARMITAISLFSLIVFINRDEQTSNKGSLGND